MAYHVFTTRAFILRTTPVGESDRLLTVLTEHYGVRQIFARSIRTAPSRMRSSSLPYACVTLSIIFGRQDILKDIRVIDPLTAIWCNRKVYTAYATLLATVQDLIPITDETDPTLFPLLTDAVQAFLTRPPSQANCILLTATAYLLLTLGYVHDDHLADMPLLSAISHTVTEPTQQAVLERHIKRGMTWQ